MQTSTVYSWLALVAVVGTLTWHYNGRPNLLAKLMPQAPQTVEELVPDSSRKKKSKPKRKLAGEQVGSGEGTSTSVSSTEDVNRRRKTATPSAANQPATDLKQQEDSKQTAAQDEDSHLSNKEFAKQFTQARSGTPLVPGSGKPGLGKKDRQANKNSLPAKRKANHNLDASKTPTEGSSTTGADGDDDLSPVGTPSLRATPNKVTKAGDVADMLEAPISGPAVLRLTDPKGTMNKVQPKPAAKPFEAAETKKQRQARHKREAVKVANEEAERERRKLMEKQIRGARMADGSSAQSRTTSFKPPTENAWIAKDNGRDQAAVQQSSVSYVEELDVREPAVESEAQDNLAVSVKPLTDVTNHPSQIESVNEMKKALGVGQTEALGASGRENGANGISGMYGASNIGATEPASSEQSKTTSWADDVVSEEEQMRMLQDQEDSWMTVPSKKDKRKGAKGVESNVSTTSEASVEPSRTNGNVQRPGMNGALQRAESSNRYAAVEQDDSTWEA